ncbi:MULTISPECIES: hypothetical protein [unclassified Aureimonas]|uniref:hypothetical protein n=1 Tax=unclassified Aureimonas TaxID=2615206 RepID=UPI0006FDD6AD|nr:MULTISPECIES: hypothetical protein [unclassified Aureimonas]KQT66270.1 hypothetical protein ASG62_19795 [Aureimonas sp. Leaf427]KQT72458.1 hypothetical protein ASG54_04165 [Aureimonas sp. Leaf460]
MISWLIDGVLLSALVVTSWRTGRMVQELRRLRSEEASFGKALAESDLAINRAAHAVVMLKSEGTRTLAALEERIAEARLLAGRLEDAASLAALQLELANDNGFTVVPPVSDATPESEWMRRLESRLASASTLKR